MKPIKHGLLTILMGILILIVIYPFSSTIAGILTETPAQLNEQALTFLPLILNGEPKTLVFVAGPIQGEYDEEDIYMIKSNGTDLVNLTNAPSNYSYLAWSPDGSRLAYHKYGEGMIIIDADGSNQTQLSPSGSEPSWSPDSSKIVFINDDAYPLIKLSIINSDGTSLKDLVSVNSGYLGSPDWSPSGNKIAYYRNDGFGHTDIYVVNSDGSEKTNLTNGLGGIDPQWSPDGSQILFGDGGGEIFVMNADGTGRTNITNSPEWESTFVWSPDGSKIAFGCSDQICVMNPDGSGIINVSGDPSAYYWPAWAPDGTLIAFFEGSFVSSDMLYSVNPDGTGKRLVTSLPDDTWKRDLNWQP